jgi:hypothetical protein
MRPPLTRRRLLAAAAGLAAGGGVELDRLLDGSGRAATLDRTQPPPPRQHAWDATLRRDAHGNSVAPRFDRLLLFDLLHEPRSEDTRYLESALRALERRFAWGPDGLLFTLAWGPQYFHRLGLASPIPAPEPLASFELPTLDRYAACLHIAGDHERRLSDVEAALVHGQRLPGVDAAVDLRPVLRWRATRTGFAGDGLPARHQGVQGIPSDHPVPAQAPLFMGFKSGFRRNQATEDDVTIARGPMRGGTTMHVSRMRLRLESWYALDESDRVARMYAPQVSARDVARFTTDAPSHPRQLSYAARRFGVVGHAQSSATVRRHDRPLILRRDFDTVDDGEAGLHFVCLQRTIQDFVNTRRAMNAARASYLNPAITPTDNNGINEFIFVVNRANYVIPPRTKRAFPLVAA